MLSVTTITVLLASVFASCQTKDPPGHLQPLGGHQPPIGQVESVDTPSPEEFYHRYVVPGRPVILSGAARLSPAYDKWTDRYLIQKHGGLEMEVDFAKTETKKSHSEEMSLSDFLRSYQQSDLYMVDTMPKTLMEEVYVPQCLACGGYSGRLQDVNLWLSSGGTRSTLHMDNMDNLNCMISGTKDWFLVNKDVAEKRTMYHDDGDELSVDVERVDMHQYPELSTIPWWSAHVLPGDCLYVPQGWLHHVRSHDRNIAVNLWWTPMSVFNHSDCSGRDYRAPVQLSSLGFQPGVQIRFVLKTLLEEYGGELPQEMAQCLVRYKGEVVLTDDVLKVFDLNKDGWLSVTEVEELKVTDIEALLPDVQLDGVNTFGRCHAYNITRDECNVMICPTITPISTR